MIKNLTIVTLRKPHIADFAKERNQAMRKIKTDWVLFVDSDETITQSLKKEIQTAIQNKSSNYQLKRQDYFLNQRLRFGETSRVRLIRLIQRGTGQWNGRVHEVFQSQLPVKTLKHPLHHQRNLSLADFLDRLNQYTTIRAQELHAHQHHFCLFELLFYPPLKFIQNYFLRLGFLDGLPGLAMALMMSLHSLMVRIKLYELKKAS